MRDSPIGFVTFGLTLNGKGLKIFEVGGIFSDFEKNKLEKILQLPLGVEIKFEGEILSVVRFYTKEKKDYYMFFTQYKFAGFEHISSKRPCYYAGSVGYRLEKSNPVAIDLLNFLNEVTERAKHSILQEEKNESSHFQIPSIEFLKENYIYEPSNLKQIGYALINNEHKIDFIELAYTNKLESYGYFLGILSQQIIDDINTTSIARITLDFKKNNYTIQKKEEQFIDIIKDKNINIQEKSVNTEDNDRLYELKDLNDSNLTLRKKLNEIQNNNSYKYFFIISYFALLLFFVLKIIESGTSDNTKENQIIDSLKKSIGVLSKENKELKHSIKLRPNCHKVQKGENLSSIAKKYSITLEELKTNNLNAIEPDGSVKEGVILNIKISKTP